MTLCELGKKKATLNNIELIPELFRHIQELLSRIQAYSEPSVTLADSTLCYILSTLVYSALACLESEAYSKLCETSAMECFANIVNGYNYFRNISNPRSLLHEINIMKFLNTGLIFTPEV